jgi:hypothetical protein
MRALDVVVLDKRFGDAASLLQVGGPIQSKALLLVGSVVALNEGVLLRVMGVTDLDLDVQASPEADQSRRKIAACRTANQSAGSRSRVIH